MQGAGMSGRIGSMDKEEEMSEIRPIEETEDVFSREIVISRELVSEFSKLTGDENPIHLEEEASQERAYPTCVAQGLLVNALMSAMMGTRYPGTVLMDQTVQFLKPVFVGDRITLRIRELDSEERFRHKILLLRAEAIREEEVLVLMECHQLMPKKRERRI